MNGLIIMENMEKQKITLRIFNDDYQIRTEMPEPELQELAAVVNGKMMKIAQNQSALTPSKVAVLAALELASELSELRQSYGESLRLAADRNNIDQKGLKHD